MESQVRYIFSTGELFQKDFSIDFKTSERHNYVPIKNIKELYLFKTCKKYLEYYQNSVFRRELSESNILKLKNEINTIIDKNEDSVSQNSLKTKELGVKTGNPNFL